MRALLLSLLLLTGCGYYSFTGASIPDDIQTLALPEAELRAATPVPSLGADLTALLTDRFIRQTRLRLEEDETAADAFLETAVEGYRNDPAAVSGAEQAERSRVTVTVRVRYGRRGADELLLDRTFSAFAEYDPASDGAEGETQAAAAALRQIADDIFTAATSNW